MLASTKFPLTYPKEYSCANSIRVRDGQRIRLNFLMLDIESDRDGSHGYW